MNEVEEKKVEVPRIDPLFFVVRELDSIKGTTREEFDKVYKEFDKVCAALDEIKKSTKDEFEKVYKEFDKVYAVLEEIKKSTKEEFEKVNASNSKEFDKVYKEFDKVYASTREEFEKVYKEFDKVYERFNRIEDQIHGLRSFTVRLVFSMAALIIAGVGILFRLMI